MGPCLRSLVALFPGFPSLGQLHYWNQRWETQREGYFHHWCFSQLLPGIAATHCANQFALGTCRLPDLQPLRWLL